MIVWSPHFSKLKRPLGYCRLLLARHRFYDHFVLRRNGTFKPKWMIKGGYQHQLRLLHNKYAGKRCFILGNGPSLKNMDLSFLKHEVTIGSNGIFKAFANWGFHTNFLLFEDTEQTELRGKEIHHIRGPIKLASIYNAYAFKPDAQTLFMNVRRADGVYWKELAPMFSTDFSNIVYLGSTVTYLALQLAYHLGCNPVYLIGVDHNYGELPKLFPPGKITVTKDNIQLVNGLHFSNDYYKIGDQIGVPHVTYQNQAYAKAREVFTASNRTVLNAGVDSHLTVFDTCDYQELFNTQVESNAPLIT